MDPSATLSLCAAVLPPFFVVAALLTVLRLAVHH
jgi:hypothetical protein